MAKKKKSMQKRFTAKQINQLLSMKKKKKKRDLSASTLVRKAPGMSSTLTAQQIIDSPSKMVVRKRRIIRVPKESLRVQLRRKRMKVFSLSDKERESIKKLKKKLPNRKKVSKLGKRVDFNNLFR